MVLDEKHFWAAMVYVEQNPVRAGLAATAWDWRWSSASAHLNASDEGWLDFMKWRSRFDGETWKSCVELGLADTEMIERMREATLSGGRALGSDAFIDGLERDFGVKIRRTPPGPKSLAKDSFVRTSVQSAASSATP